MIIKKKTMETMKIITTIIIIIITTIIIITIIITSIFPKTTAISTLTTFPRSTTTK